MAEKEVEKLEKYQLITDKFIKMRGKESRHCAVVNRALGVVSKCDFEKYVTKFESNARMEIMPGGLTALQLPFRKSNSVPFLNFDIAS